MAAGGERRPACSGAPPGSAVPLNVEPNGGASAMRVGFLGLVLPIAIVYSVNCLRAGQMLPIPWEVVAMVTALAGAKVTQRKVESKNEEVR